MKKLLKSIQRSTGNRYRFAELRDGKAYYLSSGKQIPEHCISLPKRNRLKDGFYKLSSHTCGGTCRIGSPSARCMSRRIADKTQCAKYVLYKIGSFNLNAHAIVSIIKELADERLQIYI